MQLITNGYTYGRHSVQAIVWHSMEGWLPGAMAHWNAGAAGAHLCVLRDGTVVLTCRIEDTAWHAGTSNVPGSGTYGRTPFWRTHNINAYSIGVELEGHANTGFTEAQVRACVRIARWARLVHGVRHEHTFDMIPGHHLHSEISAMRGDPGPHFPLDRVLRESA